MSLSFGMLIIVVGGIIKRFDDNNVDSIFWLGTLFTVFLLAVIFLLIIKISQKTKEIKELQLWKWAYLQLLVLRC